MTFPFAQGYAAAVTLLVLAGVSQYRLHVDGAGGGPDLAPPKCARPRVGLFNTSMLGLRAGSGVTVGVVGALIGVELSLTLSAVVVVAIALGLLASDVRRRQSG